VRLTEIITVTSIFPVKTSSVASSELLLNSSMEMRQIQRPKTVDFGSISTLAHKSSQLARQANTRDCSIGETTIWPASYGDRLWEREDSPAMYRNERGITWIEDENLKVINLGERNASVILLPRTNLSLLFCYKFRPFNDRFSSLEA
jgi:hypothetical protein